MKSVLKLKNLPSVKGKIKLVLQTMPLSIKCVKNAASVKKKKKERKDPGLEYVISGNEGNKKITRPHSAKVSRDKIVGHKSKFAETSFVNHR